MAKYNKKAEKGTTKTINDMGSIAYKLSPEEELVATVLTTFMQSSYYEKESAITKRIQEVAEKVDPYFVAQLAVYARREANMRSVSHYLAALLAKHTSGTEWGMKFYNAVLIRPDDASEIVAAFNALNKNTKVKLTNAMRKGIRRFLEERMDAYRIDKYKMNGRDISLIDLVNLTHPSPNQVNAEAYRRLMNGESLEGLYATKILEKEKSRAGQKGKDAKKEVAKVIEINSENMPIFNLLRNLVDIVNHAPEQVDKACKILTNPEKIKKSKLLPFRFMTAYLEVEKLVKSNGVEKKVVFGKAEKNNAKKVLSALETAIELSTYNAPVLVGNTAILIDHSGSMRGDGGGSGLISQFSKVTSSHIATLFGAILMKKNPGAFIGLFGDRLIRFEDLPDTKILEAAKSIHEEGRKCGGATEHGIYEFFEDVIKHKTRVDTVITFSDMVIGENCSWYGKTSSRGSYKFQHLFREFRKINPHATVISVDIKQTKGTTVWNAKDGVTQVAGWSEKIFDLLGGGRGYEELIKEIRKIQFG